MKTNRKEGETDIRLDHRLICARITPGADVLDLGCGDGTLMSLLVREKQARVQGIELDGEAVQRCVAQGLMVFQGDIEGGLKDFPDRSILNQSMQEVTKVDAIIHEALRVGEKVIVGFPNFANYASRFQLFFQGKAPMTKALPHFWYDTPNVRCLSISDFHDFCRQKKVQVLKAYYLGENRIIRFWPNLFALNAVFLLTR